MTVITKELSNRLAEARKKRLLVPLKEVVIQSYPKECRVMKEEYLNDFLNQSYDNAQKCGTETFGEIKSFTFLAFNLGIHFYEDPINQQIYTLFKSSKDIEVKLDRAVNHFIKKQMIQSKEELIGYKTALAKLEKVAYHVITEPISANKMASYLKAAYPQRVESLGGVEHLERLIPTHYELLESNRLDTPLGHFVYFMLWMFMGSGMLHDPHYQWIQKHFYDEEPNKNKKSSAFYRVLMKRLRKEKQKVDKALKRMNDGIL